MVLLLLLWAVVPLLLQVVEGLLLKVASGLDVVVGQHPTQVQLEAPSCAYGCGGIFVRNALLTGMVTVLSSLTGLSSTSSSV